MTFNIRSLLARTTMSTVAVKVVSTGLGFGLNVFLARMLGTHGYGDYVYALSWVTILVFLGTLGMDAAALRFVAGYIGREAWGSLHGFVRRGMQLVSVNALVILSLFGLGLVLLGPMLRPDLIHIFVIGMVLIPVGALLAFAGSCLQALDTRFVILSQSVQLSRTFLLGLLVLGLVALAPGLFSATSTMALNLAATSLLLVGIVAFFYRRFPLQAKQAAPAMDSRLWVTTALSLLVLSGLNMVISQADTIMTGMFLGTEKSGFYATASRIAILISLGISSVNAVLAPIIARHHAQQRIHELQGIVSAAAKGIFLFSLAAAIVLLLFGKVILGFFGPEFRTAYPALVILVCGQLIDSLAGSVGNLLIMTGHQREVIHVVGGCALLNIALNAALIPVLGLPGAAVATALTLALWNIILVRRVRLRLGINSTIFRVS